MKILDTNAVNHILKNSVTLSDDYFFTDDIQEETEIAEAVIGRRLSSKVTSVSESPFFDRALYLAHYKNMLNKHGGRSFYRMSGFGDISILALLKTVEDVVKEQAKSRLFSTEEELEVFTEDQPLIKKIKKESTKVKILKNTDVK